jgi:hypothetical protein
MVLFHCAFVALKARCPFTITVHPNDYRLSGERRLFQAQILDDGYEHSLTIFQDDKCGGLRLHAAVWNGELTRCPVWTAFVTHQCASPDWLVRKSMHRIWLADIQPYVFCQKYKSRHQRRSNGEFEIYFSKEEAADAFYDIFDPRSDYSSITSVHEGSSSPGPGAD